MMNTLTNFSGIDNAKMNARQLALRTATVAVVGIVGYNMISKSGGEQ